MEWLEARVKADGKCWIWQKAFSGNGVPQGYINGKVVTVRRFLWNASHEEPCPQNMQVRPRCNNPECVRPDHLKAYPKNEFHIGSKHSLTWINAMAQTARAKSRLTDEMVHEIRLSSETSKALAKRYGMAASHVGRIRAHKARKDFTNPYLQLVSPK